MASPSRDWRRLGRLARMALAPFVAIVAILVGPPWFRAIVGAGSWNRTIVGFLVGLEVAYVAALAIAGLGAVVFGVLFRRARRRRQSRPWLARALLACGVGLVALALAEGTAAAWQAWTHRTPALATADPTLPERFAESSPDDEATVTVLGESSAEGMPFERWLSVGRIVAWQLGRAIPSRRFRLDLVAQRGDTLAGQHRKLAEVRRRPDVLIVYCGHNEFAAGIPWSRRVEHYRDDRAPTLWGLEERAACFSPLCGLIHETADEYRVATRPPPSLVSPLVDAPAYTPDEYEALLAGFRRRLEAIAAFGERCHAVTVLVAPPGNDAGFEPNRSFLAAGTSRPMRAAFARDFLAVRGAEDADADGALARYRRLVRQQPGFAEAHFRLARLLARAGRWDEASRHFEQARDLDGIPMRCIGPFQQAYRDVAARHPDGCILVDGQALFHAIGRDGLLGDDLFHDAMHPSLRGHIALAQAILEGLYARRALGWRQDAPAPLVDPTECAAHFGMRPRDWEPMAERGAMFYAATAPLRYDPSERLAKKDAFRAAARRIAAGEPAESVGLPNLGIPATPPLAPDSLARRPS